MKTVYDLCSSLYMCRVKLLILNIDNVAKRGVFGGDQKRYKSMEFVVHYKSKKVVKGLQTDAERQHQSLLKCIGPTPTLPPL